MPFKDTKQGTTHYYGDGCGMSEHNDPEKTEQYKCRSYYDDSNVLKDCTCGKCASPSPESKGMEEWEEELRGYIDTVFKPKKVTMKNLDREIIIDFIRQLLTTARQEADQRVAEAGELLEVAVCPESGCDKKGTIANQVGEDEWDLQQCQWCDEKKKALADLQAKIK